VCDVQGYLQRSCTCENCNYFPMCFTVVQCVALFSSVLRYFRMCCTILPRVKRTRQRGLANAGDREIRPVYLRFAFVGEFLELAPFWRAHCQTSFLHRESRMSFGRVLKSPPNLTVSTQVHCADRKEAHTCTRPHTHRNSTLVVVCERVFILHGLALVFLQIGANTSLVLTSLQRYP
jgi:hypothetical protein